MFDLGWTEIAFLLALALVVIGPRDLPKLARGLGQMKAKIRRLMQDAQFSLKKLELEVDRIDNPAPPDGQPDYYHLLPEHVRKAMETTEPVRDAAVKQKIEADFEAAVADIRARLQRDSLASSTTTPASSAAAPSAASSSHTKD